MDIWQAALFVGAFLTALAAWRSPRGLAAITAVMASFALSGVYWDEGFPAPALFGIACDVAAFFAIYAYAAYRWEIWVLRVIQAMVLTNLVWMVTTAAGGAPSHYMFATSLEGMNWVALAIIGAGTAAEAIGETDHAGLAPDHHRFPRLRRALLALRSPRRAPPFWRVP